MYESIQLTSDQYLPDKLAKFGTFKANLGIRVFEQFVCSVKKCSNRERHKVRRRCAEQQRDAGGHHTPLVVTTVTLFQKHCWGSHSLSVKKKTCTSKWPMTDPGMPLWVANASLGRAKPEGVVTGGRLVVVRWLGNLHLRRDPPRSTQQPAKH